MDVVLIVEYHCCQHSTTTGKFVISLVMNYLKNTIKTLCTIMRSSTLCTIMRSSTLELAIPWHRGACVQSKVSLCEFVVDKLALGLVIEYFSFTP